MVFEDFLCIPIMNNTEQRELLRNQILTSIVCLKRVFASQGLYKAEDLTFKILGSSNYFLYGIVTLLISGQLQKEKWFFPLLFPKIPLQFQKALISVLKKTTFEYTQEMANQLWVLSDDIAGGAVALACEASIREKCRFKSDKVTEQSVL